MAAHYASNEAGVEVSYSRNRRLYSGFVTNVTAGDTIVFPLAKILSFNATNVTTGASVGGTISGGTVTVGSGPNAQSLQIEVWGY